MKNFELTLLEEDQLEVPNVLSIFNIYGPTSPVTDLAILTNMERLTRFAYSRDDHSSFGRCGSYFLKTPSSFGKHIKVINNMGALTEESNVDRTIGIRPVLIAPKEFINNLEKRKGYQGMVEVSFGEYPQYVENDYDSIHALYELYSKHKLIETGKTYTFDVQYYYETELPFYPIKKKEVLWNGKKYLPFIKDVMGPDDYAELSNKERMRIEKLYWLKVEPITWLYDEKTNLLVSKRILLSGIPFSMVDVSYEKSEIKKYLDTYMKEEIIPSTIERSIMDENPSLKSFVYWKRPKGRR